MCSSGITNLTFENLHDLHKLDKCDFKQIFEDQFFACKKANSRYRMHQNTLLLTVPSC